MTNTLSRRAILAAGAAAGAAMVVPAVTSRSAMASAPAAETGLPAAARFAREVAKAMDAEDLEGWSITIRAGDAEQSLSFRHDDVAGAHAATDGELPSFVAKRKRAERPTLGPRQSPGRNLWRVRPTGRYSDDIEQGQRLALEYLQYVQRGAMPLAWIVIDMPKDLTGVEIGFFRVIDAAAAAGGKAAGVDRITWADVTGERSR